MNITQFISGLWDAIPLNKFTSYKSGFFIGKLFMLCCRAGLIAGVLFAAMKYWAKVSEWLSL